MSKKGGSLDVGAFMPLMALNPTATIPVVQISLHANMDFAEHVALGRILARYRCEGTLIIGACRIVARARMV